LPQSQIVDQAIEGLVANKFIEMQDVIDTVIRFEPYAYVIYDLNHRQNADHVLEYLMSKGIHSAGRFAQFEYLNTDGVVEQTLKLAERINLAGPK
jgi:protoporphyrinogen oxidase